MLHQVIYVVANDALKTFYQRRFDQKISILVKKASLFAPVFFFSFLLKRIKNLQKKRKKVLVCFKNRASKGFVSSLINLQEVEMVLEKDRGKSKERVELFVLNCLICNSKLGEKNLHALAVLCGMERMK